METWFGLIWFISDRISDRLFNGESLIKLNNNNRINRFHQNARQKEAERRKEGQMLSKAKAEREDILAQQMAERIRTEKAKNKAAKDAIRQKIAQDKAERAAREEVQKRERLQAAARIDPRLDRNETTVQW